VFANISNRRDHREIELTYMSLADGETEPSDYLKGKNLQLSMAGLNQKHAYSFVGAGDSSQIGFGMNDEFKYQPGSISAVGMRLLKMYAHGMTIDNRARADAYDEKYDSLMDDSTALQELKILYQYVGQHFSTKSMTK
jgi:hypothetical protein